MKRFFFSVVLFFFAVTSFGAEADNSARPLHWMKIHAKGSFERSALANEGVSIEFVDDEYVVAIGTTENLEKLQRAGRVEVHFPITPKMLRDFPNYDSNFHNYAELTKALEDLAQQYPELVELSSIGKTHEGRDIWAVRITQDVETSLGQKPAVIFMGGHHAREHVSVEMPLKLAKHLAAKGSLAGSRESALLASREVHIIPLVNPDGAEFDIADGSYELWRKNRRNNGKGVFGVDLNRNYSFGWGTGGSSKNPNDETYMGPSAFSEPETQAIKAYVEGHQNINILLSFHTFSELILYPWGGQASPITNTRDRDIHIKMAQTMSAWNGYKPMQAADLYVASGDTVDWAFGQEGIIGFTFELDPKSSFATMLDPNRGFYPGQGVIPTVFQKNLEPSLYLIEYSDNPSRVLQAKATTLGLKTPLFD